MTPTPTTPSRSGAASAFTALTMTRNPQTHRLHPSLARRETAGDRKPPLVQTLFESEGYSQFGKLSPLPPQCPICNTRQQSAAPGSGYPQLSLTLGVVH